MSESNTPAVAGSRAELAPAAWAVTAHGRVQRFVASPGVADEFVCSWRESDTEATAVPLYSWAAVEAAVAAERERCAALCLRPPGWLSDSNQALATEIRAAILGKAGRLLGPNAERSANREQP